MMSSSAPPRDDLGYPIGLARPARRVAALVPYLSIMVSVKEAGHRAVAGAAQLEEQC
jgi:hypothetical protein